MHFAPSSETGDGNSLQQERATMRRLLLLWNLCSLLGTSAAAVASPGVTRRERCAGRRPRTRARPPWGGRRRARQYARAARGPRRCRSMEAGRCSRMAGVAAGACAAGALVPSRGLVTPRPRSQPCPVRASAARCAPCLSATGAPPGSDAWTSALARAGAPGSNPRRRTRAGGSPRTCPGAGPPGARGRRETPCLLCTPDR